MLHLCFPYGLAYKESACNMGDLGTIFRLGRSPEEGKGYPLQYSGLENPMDYTVQGVAKSRRRLSDFHSHLRGFTCVFFFFFFTCLFSYMYPVNGIMIIGIMIQMLMLNLTF